MQWRLSVVVSSPARNGAVISQRERVRDASRHRDERTCDTTCGSSRIAVGTSAVHATVTAQSENVRSTCTDSYERRGVVFTRAAATAVSVVHIETVFARETISPKS